jgi:hypothetical protein
MITGAKQKKKSIQTKTKKKASEESDAFRYHNLREVYPKT